MMKWTLAEPCCGSAAFTLHMLGMRKSIMPYQGSKWRYRHALEAIALELGFHGTPDSVTLTDAGPWGDAWGTLLTDVPRRQVAGILARFGDEDPRVMFDRLQGRGLGVDTCWTTAEFLFLQRLAFSGKAVGVKDGKWRSPGFNKTSAYGTAATRKFGRVRPMIPSLIERLRELPDYRGKLRTATVDAFGAMPWRPVEVPTLVYLDPPFVKSTRYPDGNMSRAEVVMLAITQHERGASVMVSEGEPIAELVALGWTARCIQSPRDDGSPFKGKQAEWVTCRVGR